MICYYNNNNNNNNNNSNGSSSSVSVARGSSPPMIHQTTSREIHVPTPIVPRTINSRRGSSSPIDGGDSNLSFNNMIQSPSNSSLSSSSSSSNRNVVSSFQPVQSTVSFDNNNNMNVNVPLSQAPINNSNNILIIIIIINNNNNNNNNINNNNNNNNNTYPTMSSSPFIHARSTNYSPTHSSRFSSESSSSTAIDEIRRQIEEEKKIKQETEDRRIAELMQIIADMRYENERLSSRLDASENNNKNIDNTYNKSNSNNNIDNTYNKSNSKNEERIKLTQAEADYELESLRHTLKQPIRPPVPESHTPRGTPIFPSRTPQNTPHTNH